MGTYHVTAKLKAGTVTGGSGGMFISGTAVAVSAAGNFKMRQVATAPAPTPAPPPPPPPAPAPAPAPSPMPTITTARHPRDFLQCGVTATDCLFIEDNRWGAATIVEGSGTGQYMQKVERALSVGPLGQVAFRTEWRWPTSIGGVLVDGNGSYPEVKGFPCVIYGARPGYSGNGSQWPAFDFAVRLPDGVTVPTAPPGTPSQIAADWQPAGGSVSTFVPAGKTPGSDLPRKLPLTSNVLTDQNGSNLLDQVNSPLTDQNPAGNGVLRASGRFSVSATGKGHFAFDIWLQQSGQSAQAFGFANSPITHEVMIQLQNWGGYGRHPDGSNADWYDHDVTLDGILYHVYISKNLNRNHSTGVIDGGGPYAGCRYNFPAGGPAIINGSFTNEETGLGRYGWKFIRFQYTGTGAHPLLADGSFNLDLSKFLNHLSTRVDSRGIPLAQGNEHIVSVELGAEMVVGSGDVTLWDYRVVVPAT